jgi:GxxExxY protein
MITQKSINELSYKIIGCAIEVHKIIGPGLLESVYESCFVEELKTAGCNVKSQMKVPFSYKGKNINLDFRIDVLVDDLVIVELKAVEKLLPLYDAQLMTYLRILHKPKGLIINFNTTNISNSLVSIVTEEFAALQKE